MPKLIMTKGLPGSGKTTWAKQYQKDNPNTARVNKDDLRRMLHNYVWSKDREKFVLDVRNFIIEKALSQKHNIIVDDTNFHTKHEEALRAYCKEFKAEFEVKDFTDVSLEECIKRDQGRPNYVGEKVIKEMYNQHLKPKPQQAEPLEGKPRAIICDLDGTLCLFGDKNPYDRDFENDETNEAVRYILDGNDEYNEIIFVSGRKDKFREVTQSWLDARGFAGHPLFMRPTLSDGENEPKDVIIKQEIYEKDIKGKYNVFFVLDDRDQVVEFWRSQGLTCLQVASGDF